MTAVLTPCARGVAMTTPRPPYVTQGAHGWEVHFTPSDPDAPPVQVRDTQAQAFRLAARIARRQSRDDD